ncbi:MAG: TerB family tellurite resistance protein [Bacteroidetes bacterium]|nr:TerB family tellurite resistance protein [Bacteroidota bacterium]
MKRIIILTALLLFGAAVQEARAQSIADLVQELALDYQKLASMKSTFKQMEQGYRLVSTGYHSVKHVAQGNFNLHEAFLDGLLLVSPTVRKYPRIHDIIHDQSELVREYHSAYSGFRSKKGFSAADVDYMTGVYNNLVTASLRNLDELTLVITDNKLRMSDNERLSAIDRIYASGHDQLTFLRDFNSHMATLAAMKAANNNDRKTLKQTYGLK